MKLEKGEIISLRMKKFKVGKNKVLLPDEDCLALAIMHKGKLYGGFIKVNFNNIESISKTFDALVKCGYGKMYQVGILSLPR